MCFRDLARQNESNSRSLWLCGEERHEQVRAARQPWTFVFDHDRNCAVLACPSDTDIASGFERSVDGIAKQVYEQLIELIMLAGSYHTVSFLANALRLPREPFAPGFPAP